MIKVQKLVVIFLMSVFTAPHAFADDNETPLCTMDAKLCPNGNHTSRTGPNCEFKPCPPEKNKDNVDESKNNADNLIQTTVTGSMESPDPVLERILELEKQGIISDVLVMESFPVLVHIKAPQRIIDELQDMMTSEKVDNW